MSNIAIKVENLGKAYQLGQIGTGTISRDLERWYARMRGKEDPFLQIGETNDRSVKGESDIVWSLRDLNFEIEQGDAVGIIGRNGAGKSTLLKILSKVTAPTTGKISGNGRIASLLEVGTGFHPELSGRENIFLNGAILGMRKKEIARKFDEIVDFAGIERYIDTPVKRYSSGMYVRLAFAVAAHLESEILIVDEVLAVGDIEFQKKCLGKMGEVSKGDGRTVLFVSHNMGSIKSLCNKGFVLANGELVSNTDISQAINYYNNYSNASKIILSFGGPLNALIEFYEVKINGKSSTKLEFYPNEDITIEISYLVKEELNDVIILLSLFNEGYRLFSKRNALAGKPKVGEKYKAIFTIEKFTLRPAIYNLAIGGWGNNATLWSWGVDITNFKIEDIWTENFHKADEGIFNLNMKTEHVKI
ncbi:ABC transporter ATP-binding protein [Pedobacter sp. Du54]|uniref:ABC transporter ATP-binding protein n=1 Tax=Pedobacter anseongensis TaxID=3133439 RepID=UPI0030982305